jgi:hypothetical protein
LRDPACCSAVTQPHATHLPCTFPSIPSTSGRIASSGSDSTQKMPRAESTTFCTLPPGGSRRSCPSLSKERALQQTGAKPSV